MSGVSVQLVACGKTFPDGTRGLDSIDLTIAAGETLAILGPSGCGKTTALRILAGLEAPDPGGCVFFDGRDVTDVPIERRNVGMVFQSYALFPNMSVAENVGYGLRVRGVARAERQRRVAELLEMVRMSALANRRIDQLSGGQRQRVALARAVAPRPSVLLLDEPLTALDARLRDELRIELSGFLRNLRITAAYVTHDQAEALALGDRIVVMSGGRIAQTGTPSEIWHSPSSRFVAEFVGTVNRIRLVARDGPRTVYVRPHDVKLAAPGNGEMCGRVMTRLFLGDRTRYVVDAADAGSVTVDVVEGDEYPVGADVAIVFRADRLLRLGDEP